MKFSALRRWIGLTPLYDTPGDGTGGGAGAGSGNAGAAGAGGAQAIKISDDTMVDFGDGKPVKYGEYKTGYMPRAQYDRGVEFLTGEAQKLQTAWDKFHAGEGAKPKGQEPVVAAAIDEIEKLSVVDGQSLKKLYNELRSQGLTPLAQAVASIATRLQQLEGNFTAVRGATGTLAEEHSAAQFESHITTALGNLGEVKGLVSVDPKNDTVREIAKDVFLSHDQASWKAGEFEKAVKTRLEGLVALVRADNENRVKQGQERIRKQYDTRKGGAKPSGDKPFTFKKGSEMARELFGSTEQST